MSFDPRRAPGAMPPDYRSATTQFGAPGVSRQPGPPPTGSALRLPSSFRSVVGATAAYIVVRALVAVVTVGLASGDIGPFDNPNVFKVVVLVVGIGGSLLSILPALVLLCRRGPRHGGQSIARMCVALAIAAAVPLFVAIQLPTSISPTQSIITSPAADFVAASVVVVAWLSTHRASRWTLLVAPPAGGLAAMALYFVQPGTSDNRNMSFSEQVDVLVNGASPDYGTAFWFAFWSSLLCVGAIIVATWLAFGIEWAMSTVLSRPLAPAPISMWDNVSPYHLRAVKLASFAAGIAVMVLPIAAAMHASADRSGPQPGGLLWSVALIAATALLLAAAHSCHGSRRPTPLFIGAAAVAVCCVALGAIGTATGASEQWGSALVSFPEKAGVVAIGVAFIAALSARPWGIVTALLGFLAPVAQVYWPNTFPPEAAAETAGDVVGQAVVLGVIVALGVAVTLGAEWVRANQTRLGFTGTTGHVAQAHPTPGYPTPGYPAMPHAPAPSQPMPLHSAPQHAMPQQSIPQPTAPQYPAFPQPAPQYPVPQHPVPQYQTFQHPAPQHPAPHAALPQQHPGAAYPNSTPPDTGFVPQTSVPHTGFAPGSPGERPQADV